MVRPLCRGAAANKRNHSSSLGSEIGIAGALTPGSHALRKAPTLNYNHVYYFHVVAAEGSIVRGAERLGVTQPTVSEQLRQLERTLGVTLFERTSAGLKLTDVGRRAYAETAVMFRSGERLLDIVGKREQVASQTLRVGITSAVSRTVATDVLMPVLEFDECVPSIRGGEYVELVHQLQGLELDLLLCDASTSAAHMPGLKVVKVHQPNLIGVATDRWLTEGRVLPHTEVPLMTYRPGSPYRFEIDKFLEERQVKPRIVADTDDAWLMLEAAQRGVCMAFVPRSVARDAIAAGRVRNVTSLPPGDVAIYAMYHEREKAAQAAKVVERLVAYARENLDPDMTPVQN